WYAEAQKRIVTDARHPDPTQLLRSRFECLSDRRVVRRRHGPERLGAGRLAFEHPRVVCADELDAEPFRQSDQLGAKNMGSEDDAHLVVTLALDLQVL